MAKKNASGSGNIRKRADNRWEARYTYYDELGQPKRGSVYGDTQKECRQKLTAILKKIDEGSFRTTTKKYTVAEWSKEWMDTYCKHLKPRTIDDYQSKLDRYIIPNLGKSQLSALTPVQIQRFINKLSDGYKAQNPLSPKSVQNVHGILHSMLKQAVIAGVIYQNPSDNTKLPKQKKPELKPLMDNSITNFLSEIQGDEYENIFIIDLFTGMRQSEILGLQWQDINFETGEIYVRRQLQKKPRSSEYVFIDATKNGKDRIISAAPTVMNTLRKQRTHQLECQLAAGTAWSNEHNLVFTNAVGGHLKHHTVYNHFKKHVRAIGMDSTRFHDLRHSCAILALQSGCSVKSVQSQLGHFSSSFTMDVYGAVSETMKKDTQDKMEQAIKLVSDL